LLLLPKLYMPFVVQCICGEGRGKRRKRKEEAKGK
jgi:hypothetical protein